MALIRMVAIVAGLAGTVLEFYATVAGDKSSPHRMAHLLAGLTFMGLVYIIWTIK